MLAQEMGIDSGDVFTGRREGMERRLSIIERHDLESTDRRNGNRFDLTEGETAVVDEPAAPQVDQYPPLVAFAEPLLRLDHRGTNAGDRRLRDLDGVP